MPSFSTHTSRRWVDKQAQKLSSRKVTHPCQGFAFCSVLMSLLAVASASSFEEAVVAAISMGGDCDTYVVDGVRSLLVSSP
jgi:ADP-ribosylglycohydrolase